MQQKVILLIVNNICQNMAEEIYSQTLFNILLHYQCSNALVTRKGYSYQFDREPLPTTVELWSLKLACFEHQRSLELVHWSRQFRYTFYVKIYPRLEQQWLELSNSKHGPQGDFSCKNAMMAQTKYFFT